MNIQEKCAEILVECGYATNFKKLMDNNLYAYFDERPKERRV